jgi:hypothetical protein
MEVIHDMFVKKSTALLVAMLILGAITAALDNPPVATLDAPQGTTEQATGGKTPRQESPLLYAPETPQETNVITFIQNRRSQTTTSYCLRKWYTAKPVAVRRKNNRLWYGLRFSA